MNAISSYPGIKLEGINDKSAVQPQVPRDPISQHTPLFMVLAEMGTEDLQVINSNQVVDLYGQQTLTPNSQFYTHQSEALQTAIEAGNATVAIKRIVPDDVIKASVSLGVDSLIGDDWFISSIDDANTSETYTPIIETRLNSAGAFGNEYFFKISKLPENTRHFLGITEDVVMYQLRLMKVSASGRGSINVPNKFGSSETYFCLRPDTIARDGTDYFVNARMNKCFTEREIGELNDAIIGSFDFHIENFTALVKASANYEAEKEVWNQDLDTIFGTQMTLTGITNEAFDFTYTGGSDGLEKDSVDYISKRLKRIKVYDDKCRDFLMSLTNANPYTDDARYPYSTLWDTGFSFDTKLAMRTLMNSRRDVWVALSCFTVADNYTGAEGEEFFGYVPEQDEQSLQGIAARLQAAFRLYPESHDFGTTAVRAIIFKNSGVINNSLYKKRRSIAIDTLWKVCKYMGAGDGNFKREWAIDSSDARVKLLHNWSEINCIYQPTHIKTLSQQNGLTYVEAFDTKNYFIPYHQTIYDDPTSVLNDFITMTICCYLEKLGLIAYRKYGMDNTLTPTKRAEKVSSFIEKEAKDCYHGRVVVEAESIPPTATSTDTVTRTVARLYTDKAKISNSYIVETHRRSV